MMVIRTEAFSIPSASWVFLRGESILSSAYRNDGSIWHCKHSPYSPNIHRLRKCSEAAKCFAHKAEYIGDLVLSDRM
jgi:hypothetical protein